MLRNIFLKTIRDNIRAILIWGILGGLLMLGVIKAYDSVFPEGPNKAKLIDEGYKAFNSLMIFSGKAVDIDTAGGYAHSKYLYMVPLLLGFFMLLMGTIIIRGEEERGSLDVLLSTPKKRISVILQKWCGMLVSLFIIVAIWGFGMLAGGASLTNSGVTAATAMLTALNVGITAMLFGTLGLLLGNFMSRKAASSWVIGIMAFTYFIKNIAYQLPNFEWLKYISPFYYYDESKPLARSVGTSAVSLAVLIGLNLVILVPAVLTYIKRDHGAYFELFKNRAAVKSERYQNTTTTGSPWLRNNFTFMLGELLPGTIIWGLSITAYILLIVPATDTYRQIFADLLKNSDLLQNIGFNVELTNEGILAISLFLILSVLAAIYAITQVALWSGEENDGHLELLLSTPESRPRLLLERFGATLVASTIYVLIQAVIFWVVALVSNVPVDFGKAAGAFFGLWVICAVVAGAGYLLSAFKAVVAVGILSGLILLSFLADLLSDLFKLPNWVVQLSIFRQYGRPIITGIDWTVQSLLLAICVGFVAIATFRFWKRDILN
ncbi:MAG: ABC transporter permease subunit [Chloroflexi bacterium]|uniref:ABC transporter permease subunit n=1 Tax=Candidatus Chlorohelix allophototropha TaxID=3003348 RepID=A0A8T7M8E7_9CHLR|nr:ABC transporter permease subunit [Chloroflexota bacterium]WJW68344.1 ABC transporter permease subunit [Chloroflexota bacterium L227-S17]